MFTLTLKHWPFGRKAIIIVALCYSIICAQPLADGQSKFLGNIYSSSIPDDFGNYWNQITPENAAKWGTVEGVRDVYNWDDLDTGYNYALEQNIPLKLHTLISGSQQPSFLAALDSASQYNEIIEWMRLVGERYPKASLVDVVTAPIAMPGGDQYPSYYEALGGSGETGWDSSAGAGSPPVDLPRR